MSGAAITTPSISVEKLRELIEGTTDRERLIREGFCFDSDRDCDAARYLIGVIDVVRWDRKLLRERIAQQDQLGVDLRSVR